MAILDERTLDFVSRTMEQTVRLGVRLGELLQPGDCLCLSGELGSGKTTLARGVGRGWGAAGRVTSPTFVIVNQYPRARDGRILYHIDCYRLRSEGDIVTAGIEDVLQYGGAFMIEWPEHIAGWLPADRLWIEMGHVDQMRRSLRFRASGERATTLLADFRRSAFGVR